MKNELTEAGDINWRLVREQETVRLLRENPNRQILACGKDGAFFSIAKYIDDDGFCAANEVTAFKVAFFDVNISELFRK